MTSLLSLLLFLSNQNHSPPPGWGSRQAALDPEQSFLLPRTGPTGPGWTFPSGPALVTRLVWQLSSRWHCWDRRGLADEGKKLKYWQLGVFWQIREQNSAEGMLVKTLMTLMKLLTQMAFCCRQLYGWVIQGIEVVAELGLMMMKRRMLLLKRYMTRLVCLTKCLKQLVKLLRSCL